MSNDNYVKFPEGPFQVFASELIVDPERSGEWIAALWQGEIPAGLLVHSWVVLQNPWRVRIVWEAHDEASLTFYEKRCAPYGEFKTEVATDAIHSLETFIARDPEGFGEWLRQRGMPDGEADYQVSLRRNAITAPSVQAAATAARALGVYKQPTVPGGNSLGRPIK